MRNSAILLRNNRQLQECTTWLREQDAPPEGAGIRDRLGIGGSGEHRHRNLVFADIDTRADFEELFHVHSFGGVPESAQQ